MAFANLLAPAGIIQADDLHRQRVVEVRHRRVVEADVPVFADSDEARIDGGLGEQVAISTAFRVQIPRVTVDIMHGAERNTVGQPGLQPQTETRRVRRRHAGILVQM
jgi:hypothetical protein